MSPSQRSQSSSGEEDAYESDYLSGDEYIEEHDTNGGNIFEMEADENVYNIIFTDYTSVQFVLLPSI